MWWYCRTMCQQGVVWIYNHDGIYRCICQLYHLYFVWRCSWTMVYVFWLYGCKISMNEVEGCIFWLYPWPATGFEAGLHDSWLNWFADLFQAKRSAGAMAESAKDATRCECIRAVATALQSWCLIKLNHCLLLWNFDLVLGTVNDAFSDIVGGWLSLSRTCCTVAIGVLDKVKLFTYFVVISFLNGTTSTAYPSHWEATYLHPKSETYPPLCQLLMVRSRDLVSSCESSITFSSTR